MKIYKFKDKLVVYVPFEVINGLDLKENDEIDFFKFNDKAFLFSKKSDIANMILGSEKPIEKRREEPVQKEERGALSEEEISVLKKLDTVRYPMRSPERIKGLLNQKEQEILQQLLKKKAVTLFKNQKMNAQLYGISKNIYDNYLMRKKQEKVEKVEPKQIQKFDIGISARKQDVFQNENVKVLEQQGFIVLQTEGEAASLSLALEESIRQGHVLGTRAFNKKFYIVLRSFFQKYSDKIIKALRESQEKIGDLAKTVGISEDGARAILYLLAENGDVSERKRDIFSLA